MSVTIIINPISGTGGRIEVARERAERAAALIAARGLDAEVFMTERAGHARELAIAALNRGVTSIVAWGGDGTVNRDFSNYQKTEAGYVFPFTVSMGGPGSMTYEKIEVNKPVDEKLYKPQ